MLFSEPKIPQCVAFSEHVRFLKVSVLFSEPKIPQCNKHSRLLTRTRRFSALQRAENSSIRNRRAAARRCRVGFSALQRAENSSIEPGCQATTPASTVSVLFSEPKIPQFAVQYNSAVVPVRVSVLFSEPKIPQSRPSHLRPSIFPTATITLRRS